MNIENIKAAIASQEEILETATAIKGKGFVDKARIAYATSQLSAIAQHMSTCHDPACSAGMAVLAHLHTCVISQTIAEGMSATDQNELINLCKRMDELSIAAAKH